mgnify:CR=1 FL=1
MTFESIIYEVKNSLAYITLNRPKALNALNQQLLTELNEAIDMIQNDDTVKAVIVTGSGEKAFAAGADITELKDLDREAAAKQSEFGNAIFSKLGALPQPVIAAVNGFALGGGMELALACDMRFVSTNAKLGLPEVGLGIMPGYGGTQRLGRLIGWGRAKQLVLATDTIDAHDNVTTISNPSLILYYFSHVALYVILYRFYLINQTTPYAFTHDVIEYLFCKWQIDLVAGVGFAPTTSSL